MTNPLNHHTASSITASPVATHGAATSVRKTPISTSETEAKAAAIMAKNRLEVRETRVPIIKPMALSGTSDEAKRILIKFAKELAYTSLGTDNKL